MTKSLKNNNNNTEIILRGQKITLRDLQSVMPNSYALIINKLLYYVTKRKFVIYPGGSNMPFVRRSLQEWSNDLELWFDNGNKRKMSKTRICQIFKKLVQDGIVKYVNYNSRIRAYAVCENNLIHKISEIIGLKFQKGKEWPEDSIDESEHKFNENATFQHEKAIIQHEKAMKVNDKPQENQGLSGNFGTGTYTYTDTGTYNKSHKSEEKNFSKNESQMVGAILHDSSDPDVAHTSTTVQDMFRVWQEEFPDSAERLNGRSASRLKAAYDSSFNEDLMAWRNYLRKVKTSEFIMDRPHLLCLKWLLSFDVIGNIGRGAYDVREPEPDMTEVAAQQNAMKGELRQQIETLEEAEICKRQRLKILSEIGPSAYRAWFVNVSMELDEEQKFRFHGSRFVVDCINTRYRDLLELDAENTERTEKIVEMGPLPDSQALSCGRLASNRQINPRTL
jgi:hypothetical protein